MLSSQKHVFWQALMLTILVFSIGIIAGIILENWRTSKINVLYQKSEIDLLDIKLQSEIYSQGEFNCEKAITENINLANRIYDEARLLDRYEKASRLTDDIILQHKKYDILRGRVLLNSLMIKQKCNTTYKNIVYFYDYVDTSEDTKVKQNVFSKVLRELKEKQGDGILLIPIAADNNLSSIELLMDIYSISPYETPVILIDRDIKITELQTLEDLEKNLKQP